MPDPKDTTPAEPKGDPEAPTARPAPPATIKLERADALELENGQLRFQLATRAVDDANRALQDEMQGQALMMSRLSHKLGFDISQYQLDPRVGTLVLRAQASPGQRAAGPGDPPLEE